MGFFEGAGNVLDLPASVLRDLLAGENPVDQFLDPFGQENRATITEATGAEGIPGFLLDMILDPVNLIGGAGVIKSLPKLLKARRAAKGAKATRKADRLRKAASTRGGVASGATRRRRKVAKAVGLSDENAHLVTEALARGVGRTLKGPKRPGMLSRMRSRMGVAGGELKEAGRYGLGQFRNLPRYSQGIIGAKGLAGLLGGAPEEPDIMEIIANASPEKLEAIRAMLEMTSGATNEPMNMSNMNYPDTLSQLGWNFPGSRDDIGEFSPVPLLPEMEWEEEPFGPELPELEFSPGESLFGARERYLQDNPYVLPY